MGDLLSCPFCGGEAAMLCGGPGNWFVQCRGCKCSTNDVQHDHAVTLWNTRAEPRHPLPFHDETMDGLNALTIRKEK